jgi:serine/threonine protein kinase
MSTEINHTNQSKSIEDDEDEQKIWVLEDFEIGMCLGNGKFGYVYKSLEKKNQKEVAIKVISKKIVAQYDFYDQLKNEIEIHTRLK